MSLYPQYDERMWKIARLGEMADDHAEALQTFRDFQRPINHHVVKILAFVANEATRRGWKKEIETWCDELKDVRYKPDNRRISRADIFKLLYKVPFANEGASAVEAMIARLVKNYGVRQRRNNYPADDIALHLKIFHAELAERLAAGRSADNVIQGLDEHIGRTDADVAFKAPKGVKKRGTARSRRRKNEDGSEVGAPG